jgi:hypothetical protein
MSPRKLVEFYRRFRGTYHLQLHGRRSNPTKQPKVKQLNLLFCPEDVGNTFFETRNSTVIFRMMPLKGSQIAVRIKIKRNVRFKSGGAHTAICAELGSTRWADRWPTFLRCDRRSLTSWQPHGADPLARAFISLVFLIPLLAVFPHVSVHKQHLSLSLSLSLSRPPLGPSQPPIQLVPVFLHRG